MKQIDIREVIGGATLVAIGLAVALYSAYHYEIGEPARMGPGFFPVALGWVLAALGAIIALLAFRKRIGVLASPQFHLRPFVAVLASVAAFSVLIERLGLIPTALIMTVIAASASTNFQVRRALLLGVVLAFLSWLIFSVGLQMTLPAFAFWK